MTTPIHVLIVDDSVEDAKQAVAHLQQAGYAPEWKRVDLKDGLEFALNEPCDVVLANLQLTSLHCLDALLRVRSDGNVIPLILISDPLGEEYAVECIKYGASDFLLRDRLDRLGPVVQRALAEAVRQRTKGEVEEALRQSEAHYRAIVDSPIAMICRWLPDGRLTYINETYADVFGRPPQELLGLRWADLLPPTDRADVEEVYSHVLDEPLKTTVEHPILDAQGRRRLIVWTDHPIVDPEGNIIEFQSVGQDVTDVRRVEQQVQLLSQAVEQSTVCIVITDHKGAITYVNPHCLTVTGFSEDEMLGQNPRMMQSGLTPPGVYQDLWRTVLSGHRWEGELQNRKKNGELMWVSVKISPIIDIYGRITHFVAVQEDITERKAREVELRRLNEELELRVEERTVELRNVNTALQRAAHAKDEFLASMSHELRTPLAGILGLTEGMEQDLYGPVTEPQLQALGEVRTSGEHLMGLINDILDVAKAEAGLMQPNFDFLIVNEVCQASLNLIRGMAQKKHLRVSFSITPAALDMEADERRLKQMLVNLLSNAVKFTLEDGRIGLDVTADEEAHVVRFCVWDSGIGIAEKDIPRLFHAFAQLDSGPNREYPGTGLGLALVRNMVELHGGSISVTSQLGLGSQFMVTLPWRRSEPPVALSDSTLVEQAPAANSMLASGVMPLILLADDNDTMVELYKTFLEASGCHVVTAQRGSEAVRLAELMHPALILMDIQMPGMDGLAAIRRLRSSREAAVASVPIISLTALAMPGDRERCLEAGADEYLSKPIALPKLAAAVSTLLKRRGA